MMVYIQPKIRAGIVNEHECKVRFRSTYRNSNIQKRKKQASIKILNLLAQT